MVTVVQNNTVKDVTVTFTAEEAVDILYAAAKAQDPTLPDLVYDAGDRGIITRIDSPGGRTELFQRHWNNSVIELDVTDAD